MRDTKELIEDLQDGFDPTPEDMPRELDRLANLCDEAAERLLTDEKTIRTLTEALAKISYELNEDPFKVLSRIDVSEHTEKKNGLTYLSWAWAWDTLMRHYPDSTNGIHRPENGFPYWTDGKTCWVDVDVTIVWNGSTRTRNEIFPIMDYKNKSIPLENLTSFDVNTALQRAWTKCIARHGLGFYIYAGQDLPNEVVEEMKKPVTEEQIAQIRELYTDEEIQKMLTNLKKKKLEQINNGQAEKMINSRDRSLVNDQSPTF